MAKVGGLGLGKGLDALLGGSSATSGTFVDENSANSGNFGNSGNAPAGGGNTGGENASSANALSLPAGITLEADGSLWADPATLMPNPNQPRTEFDETALNELADSIRENGVLQPIIVEAAEGGGFFIIAGERRTRASKIAGLAKVPVQLRHYNNQKKLEVALIENIQREDLNPIEEATAYASLMQMGDLSQDEVAKKVGKNRSTVANALRLLKLPEDMQRSLVSGQITAGHARALLSVTTDADRRVLFGKITGDGISVREAERLANEYNNGGRAAGTKKSASKPAVSKDPDILAIEQQFLEALGTKCTLNGTLEKGKIEVEYFSRADLDRLYEILSRK